MRGQGPKLKLYWICTTPQVVGVPCLCTGLMLGGSNILLNDRNNIYDKSSNLQPM